MTTERIRAVSAPSWLYCCTQCQRTDAEPTKLVCARCNNTSWEPNSAVRATAASKTERDRVGKAFDLDDAQQQLDDARRERDLRLERT